MFTNVNFMWKMIKLYYPSARVRTFGSGSYIVEDSNGKELGCFRGSPEQAIHEAYKLVRYQ